MPISVEIRDERGKREGEAWWHKRSTALLCQEDPRTTCLRFIDPYGDTTFNQLQLPVLLAELTALQSGTKDEEARAVLAGLLSFLESARDHIHTYVVFVGD